MSQHILCCYSHLQHVVCGHNGVTVFEVYWAGGAVSVEQHCSDECAILVEVLEASNLQQMQKKRSIVKPAIVPSCATSSWHDKAGGIVPFFCYTWRNLPVPGE